MMTLAVKGDRPSLAARHGRRLEANTTAKFCLVIKASLQSTPLRTQPWMTTVPPCSPTKLGVASTDTTETMRTWGVEAMATMAGAPIGIMQARAPAANSLALFMMVLLLLGLGVM